MKVIDGGNFAFTRGVKYPIVVSEDTEYRLANFAQQTPHTDGIFSVAPGVLLRLVDCNLTNVTVPDGVEIVGGQLAHIVREETGLKEGKTHVSLLHECEKCVTAHRELAEGIEAGDLPKDATGRILHHEMKDRYRARRDFTDLVDADLADVEADNAACMAKFGK